MLTGTHTNLILTYMSMIWDSINILIGIRGLNCELYIFIDNISCLYNVCILYKKYMSSCR